MSIVQEFFASANIYSVRQVVDVTQKWNESKRIRRINSSVTTVFLDIAPKPRQSMTRLSVMSRCQWRDLSNAITKGFVEVIYYTPWRRSSITAMHPAFIRSQANRLTFHVECRAWWEDPMFRCSAFWPQVTIGTDPIIVLFNQQPSRTSLWSQWNMGSGSSKSKWKASYYYYCCCVAVSPWAKYGCPSGLLSH